MRVRIIDQVLKSRSQQTRMLHVSFLDRLKNSIKIGIKPPKGKTLMFSQRPVDEKINHDYPTEQLQDENVISMPGGSL